MRKSALDADFSRAQRPCFDRFLRHGLEAVKVAVRFARAAAESAKLAADKANVGEIHIAIDHVGDEIADQIAAQHVGCDQQGEQIIAFGIGQQQALFAGEHAAILRRHDLLERVAQLPTRCLLQLQATPERGSFPVRNPVARGSQIGSQLLLDTNSSTKQSVAAGRIRSLAAASAGLISESSNDTRRGAS